MVKRLFNALKGKLEYGGTYAEGEAIGLILSMIACFLFIFGMLLLFN